MLFEVSGRPGAFTMRPGSSVGTSVRLKSGRSAVRPRPWPRSLVTPTCSLRSLRGAIVDYLGGRAPPNPPRAAFGGLALAGGGPSFWGRVRLLCRPLPRSPRGTSALPFVVPLPGVCLSDSPSARCLLRRLSFFEPLTPPSRLPFSFFRGASHFPVHFSRPSFLLSFVLLLGSVRPSSVSPASGSSFAVVVSHGPPPPRCRPWS